MRIQVQSLPLLSGLRVWRCHELWCRLHTQLGSHIAAAVVQASAYSLDSTPSLGTSICCEYGPKKQTNKRNYLIDFYFLKIEIGRKCFQVVKNQSSFIMSALRYTHIVICSFKITSLIYFSLSFLFGRKFIFYFV